MTTITARTRRTHRRFAAAVLAVTVLAGCSAEDDAGSAGDAAVEGADEAAPGVRVVSPAAGAELLAADPAPVLIDVRTPGEFAEGHIEGATLVDYNAPDFRDRIAELDPTASYVIYCRSGNRSAGAREVMTELGFEDVADIDGGWVAWVEQGLPVTS